MKLFHQMADVAAAKLLGASAEHRMTNEQLSAQLEQMALSDPDLAEHYTRLAAALPVLEVQRALQDTEMDPPPRIAPFDTPRAA